MSFSLRRGPVKPARSRLIAAFAVASTALAATALAGPARAATVQYKLTLSPLVNSQYFSINANGDIIGEAAQRGHSFPSAALFRAGSTTPLFLNPPASQVADNPLVTAAGLNNADQVVGNSDTGDFTALLWPDSSTPTNLSQLPALASSFETEATGINNNGVITGWGQGLNARGTGDTMVPFTIKNGTVTKLPELPNGVDGQPESISDTGIIAGQADTTSQDDMAVEWVNGAIGRLATLPSTLTSEALGVNDSGQAVGGAVLTSDDSAHAVLWANGKATDLHFGPGGNDASANAINDSGVIVGDGSNGDAFVFQNGTATDLNKLIPAGSGVTLNTANGINAAGDIVGTALNAAGVNIGYELTPVS